MQLSSRQTGFVRTEGGLLPADLLERVRALDRKLPGLDEASYGLPKSERFGEATTKAWNNLIGAWTTFGDELAKLSPNEPATTTTRERFLLPLMVELGYGRLSPTRAIDLDGKSYPISHGVGDIPLHLVGANVPLDRRSRGVAGAAGQSPHGLLQELLNRSPERLWGIVSNGLILRILRDNASLTRQAYVEFDLEAIFNGESYADFALLWHVAHRSRLEPQIADGADEDAKPTVHGCYLERWSKVAEEIGARAKEKLRDGVQEAIEALGSGFLRHAANTALKTQLQAGELSTQDYYRELLRLVYRLILLFVAEDRDLLLDPKADPATRTRYASYYSTARLRRLAERRKGSRHADLYAGLQVVITALGRNEGAPGIGLPPLGGFLFGSEACPDLDGAALANSDLLDAVRKLTLIEEKGVLRSVDYRNMGSEELGSIYESLLERHPELDIPSGSFILKVAAGHERKTTGSYYTPSSLISVLLDSALDPVLAEAADKPTKDEAERAILELSVVDPAAGSGHFLVAAAHRIAKRLAQVRTEDEEPAPAAVTTALRDVIGHCLYAVDINPMAVELCKVSLWLEALEPGKPLTFLDAHIKCGNSLLGTTPELIAAGIPDAAYDPIEGDDKEVCRALKKRNKAEREGQLSLGEAGLDASVAALALAMGQLRKSSQERLDELRAVEARFQDLSASARYRTARLTADAWTAAMVCLKSPGRLDLTTSSLRRLAQHPESLPESSLLEIAQLATEYQFFHWPIEFADIFQRGGFDLVIGNPPWDRVKLQEKEFFAERAPAIAEAQNAATRKRLIALLQRDDPPLWDAFRSALRRSDGESRLLHDSWAYPLTGRGDINTYAVFAELARRSTGPTGRAGMIVPTGIATDDTTRHFFANAATFGALSSLYDFVNDRGYFPGVGHGRQRFSLLTVAGTARPITSATLAFFLHTPADLLVPDAKFSLDGAQFALLNPNTLTTPTFHNGHDADIAISIYRRVPILIREDPFENPWEASFLRMFDMANDSHLFLGTSGKGRLPLWEAKLIHQFTNRYGDYALQEAGSLDSELPRPTESQLGDPSYSATPKYWVGADAVESRLDQKAGRGWLLGFRGIARSTDERTIIASILPEVAVSGKLPLLISRAPAFWCVLANLNSFVLDWVARQKVGGTDIAFFYLKQLPILPPSAYESRVPWAEATLAEWLRPYVVELSFTAWDLAGFAQDVGWEGPPFVWDSVRRRHLRAEIDAAFFRLYGLSRTETEYVLTQFPIVQRNEERRLGHFVTRDLILGAFDAMAAATRLSPYVSMLSPGPGAPAVAHPAASGEPDPQWIPWEDVIIRVAGQAPSAVGDPALWRTSRSVPENNQAHDGDARLPGPAPILNLPTGARHRSASPDFEDPTLADLVTTQLEGSDWQPEEVVDPATLQIGARVRHRSFGDGTISAIRGARPSTYLLIRFHQGEREIAFGYGVLEFQR
jgi:type I restriction-modification system DNA methylase subunit